MVLKNLVLCPYKHQKLLTPLGVVPELLIMATFVNIHLKITRSLIALWLGQHTKQRQAVTYSCQTSEYLLD